MTKAPTPETISGIATGDLPALGSVLEKWCALMLSDWGKEDAPWWYNERASVSQLAGAVWQAGGWAFEEYAVHRKAPDRPHAAGGGYGRCDLMIEVGDLRLIAEAKQRWPSADRSSAAATRAAAAALNQAWAEAETAPDGAGKYRRFGVVFVSPSVSKKVAFSDALAGTLDDLVTKVKGAYPQAALAWAFPGDKRHLRSKRYSPARYFPGTMMILANRPPSGEAPSKRTR